MANVFDRLDRIESGQTGKKDVFSRLDRIQPVKSDAEVYVPSRKNKIGLSGDRYGTSVGRGFAGKKTTMGQRVADTVKGGVKGSGADNTPATSKENAADKTKDNSGGLWDRLKEAAEFATDHVYGNSTPANTQTTDDPRKANLLDLTLGSVKRGYVGSRKGQEAYKAMMGKENELEEYTQKLSGSEYNFQPEGLIGTAVSGAAELLGQQVRQWTDPRSLSAAGGAAAMASVAGKAGPQALIPEEIVTVPAMFGIGMKAGSSLSNFEIEAGNAYLEMLENGISEDTAKKIALVVGGGNAALEGLQLDELFKSMKVLQKSGADETVLNRIMRVLIDRGLDVTNETFQETAQEGVTIAGSQAASKLEKGDWQYDRSEVANRLGETALSSALSFGLMNIPGGVRGINAAVQDGKRNTTQEGPQMAQEAPAQAEPAVQEDGTMALLRQAAMEMQEKGSVSSRTADRIMGDSTAMEELGVESTASKSQQRRAVKNAVESYVQQDGQDVLRQAATEMQEDAEGTAEGGAQDILRQAAMEMQEEQAQPAPRQDNIREQLRSAARDMGENGTKALAESYDGSADAAEYYAGFAHYYKAGVRGSDMAQVNSQYADSLTEGQKLAAFSAGQNDAAASLAREERAAQYAQAAGEDSGLVFDDYVDNNLEPAMADRINWVAKRLGLRVRYVAEDSITDGAGHTVNAQIRGKEVLVERNNRNPELFLVGHEITHRMQELAPKEYRALRNFAAQIKSVQEDAERKQRLYQGTYEEALDEATADYVGDMLKDGALLDEFIEQHRNDRTLLEKLRDAFRAVVAKLTGAEKKAAQTAEGKLTAALEAAGKQAASLQGKADGATMDAVKLSLKDMSEGERAALLQYKSSESYKINAKLRDGTTLTPAEQKMVADLDAALEKLPVHEGTVYRRLSFDMEGQEALDAFLAEHAEGDIVPYEAYTSSSTDIDGYPVSGELTATLVIDSKTGRDMAGIGNNFESEVVFPRGCDFVVERVTRDAQGNPVIYMKEDAENGIGQLHPEKRVQAVQQVQEKGKRRGNLHKVSETDTARGAGERNLPGVRGEGTEKVKFSLKTPVEETRDLLALHNKDEKSILAALDLGGLPMPSIAVVKAKEGHSQYGPISLVFNKATIDPQADSRNKVYGGDAWTPTSPRLEYEANSDAEERLRSKYYELVERVGHDNARPLYDYAHELEDALNRNGGEAGLLERHKDDTRMMNLFLADSGQSMVQDINTETVTRLDDEKIKLYDHLIQRLGEDVIGEMRPVGGESPMLARKRWVETHGTELEAAYSSYLAENGIEGEALPAKKLMPELVRARNYLANGPETRRTEFDAEATHKAIREAVDPAKYEAWLHDLFDGVEGRKGLYNGKEVIDRNGNRRAWGQLHYAYTLENIVKAMRDVQSERGQGFWGVSATGIQALATPSYESIQDIKADSGRLGLAEGSEYDAKVKLVDEAINNVLGKIVKKTGGTMDYDYAATALKNAAGGKKTVDAIIKSFAADGYKISSKTAQDIQGIFKATLEIPTGYFEAKPQRAVGFDEVLAAVIPSDSSEELRSALAGKGVNVLTYESGNEADRLEKVNSVEGAKFSRKEGTFGPAERALQEENEMLRERVEYWKSQTRRTTRVTTDKKAVAKAAKDLVKTYGADIAAQDIQGDLQSLYDYLASGYDGKDELTYTEARRRAEKVARTLVENALETDSEMYDQYKDLRDYLRRVKLNVPESVRREIADYGDFRKANMGRLNLGRDGQAINNVYRDLSMQWPEFFDEHLENNPADQLRHMAEVMGDIYTITQYNPNSENMAQAVAGAANEIMEMFFDLPQTKKTFADKQAEKLADLREKNQERVEEAIATEQDTRARQLKKLKDNYAARDKRNKEKRTARELRGKIIRHVNALNQKLLRPNDKQNVPESLRTAVAAMLNSINLESNYTIGEDGKRTKTAGGAPAKRTEAFRKLKEEYAKILRSGEEIVIDPSLFGSEAEEIEGGFDAVIAMGDTKLADMTAEQLATVWQVVKTVEHSVNTAGKVLSQAKYESTKQWADALTSSTIHKRARTGKAWAGLHDLETPYTFFANYGEAGKAIYRMLRDAQDQQQLMIDRVTQAVEKIVKPETVKKLEQETHEFTTGEGKKLTLTTAHIMELYELMKRDQAQKHLVDGGIFQPEIKSAKIRRSTEAVKLTMEDLAKITGTLTAEEMAIADRLQGLTRGLLADYGNEASMRAYGYKKFTEEDYWPIKVAKEGLHANIEKGSGNTRSIKNIGLAKSTTAGAYNPLELGGIFDTFARHAGDMTDYAAWLCPMEDANRLFNFEHRDENGLRYGENVKGLLERVGGEGSQAYWQNLMEDIQNGIGSRSDSPLWNTVSKSIGSFKGAAVGANARVVIQQPTAFFRAAAVLRSGDLAKGMGGGVTKGNGWKKALKYAPIAMRKDAGGFDIAAPKQLGETMFGKTDKVQQLNNKLSAAAGKADAVTWGKLWNACEWAVARKYPNIPQGSQAFYRQTAQQFAEVIDQTQVVDGVLQRSNIMRSSDSIVKQATSFMGEPIMSLNLLLRSWEGWRYEQEPEARTAAKKAAGRAALALVATNVVNALAQSVVDAARDDDEDKKYWERFWAAFTGVSGDEESGWEMAWNGLVEGNVGSGMNPVTQVPFAKDILSLMQGYDVSRTEMEVFSDLIQAGRTAIQSMDGQGKKTRAYAMKGLLAAGAKLFGIPVSNMTRDLWGLMRTAAVETDNIPVQYEMEKAIYNLSNEGNKGRYYDIMYRALEQGDLDSYHHIREDLIAHMALDGKSMDAAMRDRYNKAVKADPKYTLPAQTRDLIGSRDKTAPAKEKEETFGAEDLGSKDYRAYTEQRASEYRSMADSLENDPTFRGLDAESRDKVLEAAYSLAQETALADNSGGQYEVKSVWMAQADDAEKAGIEDWEYVLFHAAYEMAESTKVNGKIVKGESKSDHVREWLEDYDGLTERQREFLWGTVYKSEW